MQLRRHRGQALVEFALIVPIILTVTLGMIAVYVLWTAQSNLNTAAQEAAAVAARSAGNSSSAIGYCPINPAATSVQSIISQDRITGVTMQITCTDTNNNSATTSCSIPASGAINCTPATNGSCPAPDYTCFVRGGYVNVTLTGTVDVSFVTWGWTAHTIKGVGASQVDIYRSR